jgi:hypothetical protein
LKGRTPLKGRVLFRGIPFNFINSFASLTKPLAAPVEAAIRILEVVLLLILLLVLLVEVLVVAPVVVVNKFCKGSTGACMATRALALTVSSRLKASTTEANTSSNGKKCSLDV